MAQECAANVAAAGREREPCLARRGARARDRAWQSGMLHRRPNSRARAVAGCSPRMRLGPDPAARPRGRRHRDAPATPTTSSAAKAARAAQARAPSSSAQAPGLRRRRRSPPWLMQMPAGVPRTRRSGAPARPSAPRSAHRAAAGCAQAVATRRAELVARVAGRPRTASGRAGPAPPAHRTAGAATPLRQLCEKTRSASSSCSREPMSYHCPGTCQV